MNKKFKKNINKKETHYRERFKDFLTFVKLLRFLSTLKYN